MERRPPTAKAGAAFPRHDGARPRAGDLLEKVWDFSFDPTTNVVDVHVGRLRRKIEAEGEAPMIRTVRGAGYALEPPRGASPGA